MTADAKDALGHISGGRVLDAATRTGTFIDFLIDGLRDYSEIVGIDTEPSEEADFVERHRTHSNVRFEVRDALDPGYPDGSFDTVSLAHSLCQFKEPRTVLDALLGLVRPGGYLIVVAGYRDLQQGPALTHVAMHDWWAEVDRANDVAHWEDRSRDDLVELVAGLNLSDLRTTDLSDDADPMDPTRIEQIDGVMERSIARVHGHPDLQARGEVLRARLHEVGFVTAATIVVVGQKPL
jgi:SAM-dependent methyltransferase